MIQIWQKIHDWLEINSPKILSDLQVGATPEEITQLEEHLQVELPDDFKQSYLIHNGQEGSASPLMGEWELFSFPSIINEWNVMKNLEDQGIFSGAVSKPIGPVKSDWWNLKWIPIAGNGAGDLICLDLAPDLGGNIGQIISFWHIDETRKKLADNFQTWLQEFANDLDSGKYKVKKKTGMLVKIIN